MKTYTDLFDRIISPENLFEAWESFKGDKRNKVDVMDFERNLEKNIFQLHRALKRGAYRHGRYYGFYIRDPKQRHIHKANVRDRVLHHAIFSVINPIFEETFIATSFSCRIGLGTHKGVDVLERTARMIGQNGTNDCFVLKCDVRKFFDSVDHDTLIAILKKRIKDERTIWLLRSIIESYNGTPVRERERERERGSALARKGIPIGNLTSQLFANVYMNELDQFIKHRLHIKHYARYTDDFAIVSSERSYLKNLIEPISAFLDSHLSLSLHPNKVSIRKLHQGIDFLGYVTLPHHRLVRTKTRKRIFKKMRRRAREYQEGIIDRAVFESSFRSYLGVLSHADAYRLAMELVNQFWTGS